MSKLVAYFSSCAATALLGAASLMPSSAALAACKGPGAPTTTQTKCVTAITIPGKPLTSFDISWANPLRAEYYLADRSNCGVDIIDTQHLIFKRTIGGPDSKGNCSSFKGIVLAGTAVDNNHSGPNGVVSHDRWLYAGDGDSTLKVIDLLAPAAMAIKQTIPTGGSTRLDEMALTGDGELLIAANNAEDPPFATLFAANGNSPVSHTHVIKKITVDPAIIPAHFGLSLEQPAWDPETQRFYTSIPIIANNPTGCQYGQLPKGTTEPPCSGGLLVTDPDNPKDVEGAFDPVSGTGVIPLPACGPNGATLGVNDNLLLGCTTGNYPPGTTSLVINAKTHNSASVNGFVGSDEVFFNKGDNRYYLAAGRAKGLGVVDATSILVEAIPQSSGSHSVAADSKRNLIFVPQIWTRPAGAVPAGDANNVSEQLCGGINGCIAVYRHDVDKDHDDDAPERH